MMHAFNELLCVLENIGFKKREAQVYLGLLQVPQGTALDIAEACGMPRTSAYDTLQQLGAKGFVQEVVESGGVRRYQPTSPERIIDILKLQADHLEQRIASAEAILPNLQALHQHVAQSFRVRFYAGQEAFACVRQEFERLTDDIWQIINYDAYHAFHDPVTSGVHQQTLQLSPRTTCAIILTDTPQHIPKMPGIETVLLPTAFAPSQGEMTVCGDRVALFAYGGDVMALDIQSPAIAATCRAAIMLAWQAAKAL